MVLKYNTDQKSIFDLNIIALSFFTIFFKWFLSFWLFGEESLINKLLFDIEDIHYFPFIFNLLDLNFSPDYLNNDVSENLIPIPIYSILFHAFFFKLFGLFSFLLLEFIFLYFFLLIITKILIKSNLNYYLAFFASVLIFILPFILENFQFFEINLNNVKNLFSFRFPRPLVTSCFYFWGIYLSLIYYSQKDFSLKNYIFTAICFAFIFVSYYYNFTSLFLLFLFIFFKKFFNEKNYLSNNYLKILISVIFFLILTTPFFIIFKYSEPDFSSMIGVIELNYEIKKSLLSYFLSKIFTIKFILVFFLITFLRFQLIKENSPYNTAVYFFYYLYISAIIAPFFFTLISPSISEIYHFLNWIIVTSILTIVIYFFLYLNFQINKLSVKSLKINLFFLSFILILFFQYFNFKNLNQNQNFDQRNDFKNLQKFIDLNSIELNGLLSFSIRPQVLWILNNKDKFYSIESSISSLNFEQLELNFIKNLKFLNLSSSDFLEIISNKKGSWRYDNEYIKYISWYKYQANSLVTFKDTNDFDNEEIKFIKKSAPTKTQQIVIPKFEIKRLINLFNDFEFNYEDDRPDLIVLDKQSLLNKFSSVDSKLYCELNGYKTLNIYVLKEINSCD